MVSGIGSFAAGVSAAPFSGAGVVEDGAAAALSDAPAEEGSPPSVVGTGAPKEDEAEASRADEVSGGDAMAGDCGFEDGAGCQKVEADLEVN